MLPIYWWEKGFHALNNLDDEIGFIIMKFCKWLLEFGRYEKGFVWHIIIRKIRQTRPTRIEV